ncbi:MAG: STAS domain-containing protein [Desulfobacula sp.]|nr:STAS domain-containing protein [Desulfobacula sp.]
MGFKIKRKKKNDIGIIHVEGDIDMFTSPGLRDTLVPMFEDGLKGIIVNLSGVSFMDSSGIATLVEGLQWSKKGGKAFVLTGLGTNVLNALSLTKLEKVFTIESDLDSAFKALS